ncbi:HPP family protein [Heyndrickxia acidicola]|uniref:CBS domain-containing protein n=1 Tax=Heyndrickxia acidicola TaxID=209389 RepID=A0ABU6MNV5_9BACI|nr:CBS domain-containing protein [Heyndrickxia acidicola]MED1204902.1 CBS domain-containing protein [Heyndrickxia acidicola]
MFIKSVMIPKHNCFVVDVNDSLEKTLEVLKEKAVDGLPVLNGEEYVGMITHYHIYKAFFKTGLSKEEFLLSTKAKDIVTHENDFFQGNEIFEETLVSLKDFPLLAVVDSNRQFKGVVTRFNVLEQFQSAFGMNRPGVRIALSSVEVEGRISRLSEIIKQFHESVISLVTFDENDMLVRRIVLKVEKKDNLDRFVKKLENAGFRILSIFED